MKYEAHPISGKTLCKRKFENLRWLQPLQEKNCPCIRWLEESESIGPQHCALCTKPMNQRTLRMYSVPGENHTFLLFSLYSSIMHSDVVKFVLIYCCPPLIQTVPTSDVECANFANFPKISVLFKITIKIYPNPKKVQYNTMWVK